MPIFLLSSPVNPLLIELQNLPSFIDPVSMSLESSRDLFFLNSTNFSTSIIYNLLLKLNYGCYDLPLNMGSISNYIIFYFFGNNILPKVSTNIFDFYKNQYRPMKKGVSNMIKLHATGAITMPIETRLHLLASSKDVIHSWAIPSAGVKIDCVPGYSSHRIMIFLVSGIFWGQCMEICGRFHH